MTGKEKWVEANRDKVGYNELSPKEKGYVDEAINRGWNEMDITAKAEWAQNSDEEFNSDHWHKIRIEPGTKVYRLDCHADEKGEYFVTEEELTELDCITVDDDGTRHVNAEKYADKMQIEAYDKDGTYKPHLTCFEVKEPIEAAESVAEANPAFGSGGGKQLYIEGDDQEKLNALGKESEIYFDENRLEKRRDVSTVVDREWIKNENPPKRDEEEKEGTGKEKEASREKKGAAMEGREVGVRAALDMHQRGKEISDVAKGHVHESQLTKMNKEFDKRWQTSSDEREEWISPPYEFGGRIKSAVTENKTAAQTEDTDGWGF